MTSQSFRGRYGAGVAHLLGFAACVAVAAIAIRGWFYIPSDAGKIVIWFIAGLLGHDLVLVPIYTLLGRPVGRLGRWAVFVRAPAILSALMLAAFWPSILGRDPADYAAYAGLGRHPYLGRWLIATAILFALGALAATASAIRGRRA
jgi:hypothetical protein